MKEEYPPADERIVLKLRLISCHIKHVFKMFWD